MYNLNLPSNARVSYESALPSSAGYCVLLFAFPRISLFATRRHRHQR